jgi:hypothetical protein
MTGMSSTNSRDHHLFGPGPKRILALDGGGLRVTISIAFLEKIERILTERHGHDVILGDYFDFIGGTSTGAILAMLLALGYRAEQLREFFLKVAPFAFKANRWHIPLLQAKFDSRGFRSMLEEIVGGRTLASPDLITGLCVIAKRMDTGTPWIISNNPKAPHWDDGPWRIGNKNHSLAAIVRASTAAPHFFDPELLPINHTEALLPTAVARPLELSWTRALQALMEKFGLRRRTEGDSTNYGLFVDGGLTPHNNPSFAMFQLATFRAFGLCWPTGPGQLSITSIGTGTYVQRLSYQNLGFARFTKLALHSLISLMNDAEMMILSLMQWLGDCPQPWLIDSEIGSLIGERPRGGPMFRFLRYDVRLERQWMEDELGVKLGPTEVEHLRSADDPAVLNDLYQLGQLAAERQIKPEHWLADQPLRF